MTTFAMKAKTAALATAFVTALGLAFVTQSANAGSVKESGSWTATYEKKEALPVGNPENGHVLLMTRSTAQNTNTSGASGTAYMDGADVVVSEIADLDRGNGSHQGYAIKSASDGSTTAKFEGRVVTRMGPDEQPITTFSGKYTYVSGTGKFAGIEGAGSYSGKVISENQLQVDWEGWRSLDEATASAK